MKMIRIVFILAIALSVAACAFARIPVVDADGTSPFVKVVRDVRESVVQIRVEAQVVVQNFRNPFFDDPFFRYFFPETPRQQQRPVTSMGSGFIYEFNPTTREAFIMTNSHVVDKGKDGTITVTLADKVSYTATIVGFDPQTDVAVIKITLSEQEKITIAPLGDSANLEIGEWAIAIGNPFGNIGLDRTVTVGVISAIGRANLDFGTNSPIYQDYIQTDAAINPGNSGGPLLNIKGEVIGINSAITSTSGGNIGIGFAIPINLAKRVVDDLVAEGKVTRAYIGILPQEITSDLMESFDLKEIAGVLVAKVEKDSPAERAGLMVGDVIIDFNGEKVPNVPKFRIAVATSRVGVEVPVKIIRDNVEKKLHIKLDAFPDDAVAQSNDRTTRSSYATGISVEAIDSQLAKRQGITETDGVFVSRVEPNSPAARAGIEAGFVIQKIEDIAVSSPAEYMSVLQSAQERLEKEKRKTMRLYVQDKNKTPQFIVLRFD
ncbi:MAG: Do family serine endopeptidase [Candidatus Cloacimonetes bacterium]|nr:Do family serine endopeptidase [Candidatus Cloacimonadota bacterium]